MQIKLILLSFFLLFSCVNNSLEKNRNVKEEYESKFETLRIRAASSRVYQLIITEFFSENCLFPEKPSDTFKVDSNDADFKQYIEYYYLDLLSKKQQNLKYIPIYNSKNKKKEYILLLSSGVDGYFNNKIKKNDTIFIEDINSKLKLYNEFKFMENTASIFPDFSENYFSYKNYFFGKKDYFIQVISIIEYFKNNSTYIETFEDINDSFLFEKNYPPFYCFKAKFINKIEDKYYFENNNYKIICDVFDEKINYNTGTVNIYGIFQSFDYSKKTFSFKNCFFNDSLEYLKTYSSVYDRHRK